MTAVASETFTSVSAPIQYAAVTAFQGGDEIDEYLDRSRRILKSLMSYTARRLRDAGAKTVDPQGAFYVFPQFTEKCPRFVSEGRPDSAEVLCHRVLDDTGVAMLPGNAFGRQESELFVRIAGVDFDGAAALEAIARLPVDSIPDDKFLTEYCQPTIIGVERLYNWLTTT